MLFEDCLSEEFIQFLWMQSDITEPLSQQEPSGQHILTASTPLQVCGPRDVKASLCCYNFGDKCFNGLRCWSVTTVWTLQAAEAQTSKLM